MKTTSFIENLRHGAAMEISVSAYEGGENFIVTAINRGGERTTSVQLEYNIGTGERVGGARHPGERLQRTFRQRILLRARRAHEEGGGDL